VVARRSTCAGIGFDAEAWGRVRPALWRRIATRPELAWLRAHPQDAGERWATLLFSAKEAFYKAQFPVSGSSLGFQAAAFHAVGEGAFEIELHRDVEGVGRSGDRLAGRFARCAQRCYAGIALPPARTRGRG
jgi:4'-phosphopantetheinyl transferase EntD